MEIDLNADLGEGAGFDAELMSLITSANVCCGLHAGGPREMATALALARKHGVAAGAHPGYADREHFGRRPVDVAAGEVFDLCVYQIGAVVALGRAGGSPIRYVKPHGALYNRACADPETADSVAAACAAFDLPVVGLPHSALAACARQHGLKFIPEGFADRRYAEDGSLVPRSGPDAFVRDSGEAVKQVERLVREQDVRTVCVHGDDPRAVAFARAIRDALLANGHTVTAFTSTG